MAQHLIQFLLKQAAAPRGMAAQRRRNGRWEHVTWAALLEQVRSVSAGLVDGGVKPGDRVALFAQSSLEFVVCDLAISAARAICVPLYDSNTADECRYVLDHSQASWVFVDHDQGDKGREGRLSRLRRVLPQLPGVQRVILLEGVPGSSRESAFAEWMAAGERLDRQNPLAFLERSEAIRAEDVAHFIYTSGTTGTPKGVMLTHGNWGYEGESLRDIGLMRGQDTLLLFLPLAHVFAQVVKAAWLAAGFTLVFGESADRVLDNMHDTHPTLLPTVPRVMEKIYTGTLAQGAAQTGLKGSLFRWAVRELQAHLDARLAGRVHASVSWTLAQRLVWSPVSARLKERLGGRLDAFISGGAPLSRRVAFFIEAMGIQVLEGFGMSETSAAATVNRPGANQTGTVGPAMPGTEVRIAPDGEVMVHGPGTMKGYYRDPEGTALSLDAEGWIHTGDVGELDAQGYLRITDRKKDLIVTAAGKNIAPAPLENQLKANPLVSQVLVYGDRRHHLTALLTVNEDVARRLVQESGTAPGGEPIARAPSVHAELQRAVEALNQTLPSYSTIKRFAVLDQDFSQERGELTPTLKVRRRVCVEHYQRVLDGLYDEASLH